MTGAALHNFSKDVFNVYVHRNASILDTRDCSPAKMFIRSEEIGSFKREKFHFNSVEAVNHYWSGVFSKTQSSCHHQGQGYILQVIIDPSLKYLHNSIVPMSDSF